MVGESLHTTPLESASAAAPTQARAGVLVVLLRLHWFIRLRWVFVAVALGALAVERFAFPESKRPWQLLVAVLSVAVINVVWMIASRQLRRHFGQQSTDAASDIHSSELFANAQVAIDLCLLTAILHCTGGVENPMAVFYLFHVGISGLLLRRWHAVLQSAWVALLFAAMAGGEYGGWLPHHALLPSQAAPGLYSSGLYVLLMIVVVVCAVFGTLYFTLRIAKVLEEREERLIEANAALQQSQIAINDLQSRRARFMQTAAHQLKSPLAIVQTLSNLIRDGIIKDMDGIQDICGKINRRSQEGVTQVTELLTFARVQEADPARHRQSHADLRTTVCQLCERFKAVAEEKGLAFHWRLPADETDLTVAVDPQDLRDCVGNLIENAIKYTSAGQVRVTVTLRDDPNTPPMASVHVMDTGIGLDPSLMRSAGEKLGDEPVFDEFRRGKNVIAAGIPGTGLGLSIVREVIEQAGGKIWVMSRQKIGTSFTVTLPLHGMADGQRVQVRGTRVTEVVVEE